VAIEGRSYRAIVVHSDKGDKRRQARLHRVLAESRDVAEGVLREAEKVEYFCSKDAEAAAARLRCEGSPYHFCCCAAKARQASGCFVLLTNVPAEGEMAHSPEEVLAAYKEQHGIERNFGFLKDPLIVNDIFLKRPDRIEVLGFILLASLLTWSLMEHVMREYLKRTNSTISGEGQETDQQAYHLHDDHEVQKGAGGQDRRGVALHRSTH
jgi:transposase